MSDDKTGLQEVREEYGDADADDFQRQMKAVAALLHVCELFMFSPDGSPVEASAEEHLHSMLSDLVSKKHKAHEVVMHLLSMLVTVHHSTEGGHPTLNQWFADGEVDIVPGTFRPKTRE